jgi:hypothetical protein
VRLRGEIEQQSNLAAQSALIKVRRERDSAVREVARLRDALETSEKALSLVSAAEGAELQPPRWMSPGKPRASAATLMAMLSDTHFDEVVNPEEMEGLNAYNREIAVIRLERWAQNVVKLARHYLAGVRYDGIILILGGDIFSGDIHEELKETNADTMLGSLLFWSEQIAAGIDLLAGEFNNIHVASVVGNHGRMSRKPRAKQRVRTNFDWLLSKMVERHFSGDARVSFQIPESADCLIRIYEHHHLVTHGDQVSGGGGIGGIYPPIMRLRARKAQHHLAIGSQFSTLWLGHWHQYLPTPSLIINGSLKGFDEYAKVSNFAFEPPQQALAIVTPERGLTVQAPVFCADLKKEKW